MAAVLCVAAVIAVVAPEWLDGPTRELPNEVSLIVDIFFNNLLQALVPLLGGWLAAGHLLAGRRAAASIFVVLPTVMVARSVFMIGAVGGSDAAWLADAARWWLLELAALATASATGLWLVRNPELRERCGPPAMRRALAIVLAALATGAIIEVLTA